MCDPELSFHAISNLLVSARDKTDKYFLADLNKRNTRAFGAQSQPVHELNGELGPHLHI